MRGPSRRLERVLRLFLGLCRVAQEVGVFVAYEYDKREWEQIATRIESKDRRVGPNHFFELLDTDTRRDVKEMVARAKAAPKRESGGPPRNISPAQIQRTPWPAPPVRKHGNTLPPPPPLLRPKGARRGGSENDGRRR